MKIEIHVLQNFAPSCLNRDDVNTPKMCRFGGETRARISSQCYKRAARELFGAGQRTKRLHEVLSEHLAGVVTPEAITAFITEVYSKMDGKRPTETAVLLYVSPDEVAAMEACLREGVTGKDAAARVLKARRAPDVALFGRMLAEKPEGNIDAACQVAHAISTHAVDVETDFYTAVDDLTQERDEVGAGMMGTQGFNSACFYRYAVIDREQLQRNLGGDGAGAADAIEAFLSAFVTAVPSAKQNSHAAQNQPSFVLFVARDDGAPVSLANAFARPVSGDDVIARSISALCKYQKRTDDLYDLYNGATLALIHDRDDDDCLGPLKDAVHGSLAEAVATTMARVRA